MGAKIYLSYPYVKEIEDVKDLMIEICTEINKIYLNKEAGKRFRLRSVKLEKMMLELRRKTLQ